MGGGGGKHIGQTMQTVLKHLVGIEGVQVPSESSNRRMILESNLLANLQEVLTPLLTIFQLYHDDQFREPPTIGKQLVNFITCGWGSSAPLL